LQKSATRNPARSDGRDNTIMARPKLKIDAAQVEKLAAINCSWEEAAAVLNCSQDTLQRRYAEIFKKGREHGKMSLKRKMWESAMGGNITMMIWLSKQMLGYMDRAQLDISKIDDETFMKEAQRRLKHAEELSGAATALIENPNEARV